MRAKRRRNLCALISWLAIAPPASPLESEPATTAPAADTQPAGLPPISPDTGVGGDVDGTLKIRVTRFQFEGNTAFSDERLLDAPVATREEGGRRIVEATVRDYLDKDLSSDDMEEVRRALTRLYVDAGYINSGAILPDQTLSDGVVRYQLVEGKLTDVVLTGNRWLNRGYLTSRIALASGPPLNLVNLSEGLELLRQNPNIRRISADLRPGTEPGEALLEVAVTENEPFQLGLLFSNKRSPSIGAEQLEVLAFDRSLTGAGDALAVRYGVNKGGLDDWRWAGADDFTVDYTFPISPADTTLSFSFTRTDSPVVEEAFRELGITSESNNFAVTLRHPFHRTANSEFAMFLSAGYRDNKTFLFGRPFSFSPGAVDGESKEVPIRFGQEFSVRDPFNAIAARSTFTFGTPWFNSTDSGTDNVADGQYFTWVGQFQYIRRLPPEWRFFTAQADSRLVFRLSCQLAADPLLSIEQFAVGGFDTVRGYRENQIVRDNGLTGSVELHLPLIASESGQSVLELIPFFDMGYGWNQNGIGAAGLAGERSQTLSSVGVGLQFTPNDHINAQIYYGHPLKDLRQNKDDGELQDHGIHFSIVYLLF